MHKFEHVDILYIICARKRNKSMECNEIKVC